MMIDGRSHRALPINQVLLLLIGLLLAYLVVDFGWQVVSSYQRQEELGRIERAIESAQDETRQLEARLNYAESAQAADAWAREQGWAKPDEVPVLVIAPSAGSSSTTDGSAQTNSDLFSHREAWWDLFFGER
jgi:cell division protein FtsB